MAATIYEVAKKSGVSIGTVSRVLNDSPLTALATRKRVLQVIDELDYQPHAMAQGLARRRANGVGVVLPLCEERAHVEVLRGIQRGLAQHHLDLILFGVDDLQKSNAFLWRALQQRRVDGLLLVSMHLSGALAVDCKRRRLPLVLADSYHHQFDSITVSNQEGALLAAQHLRHRGYRHLAILAGPYENISAQQRLQDCQRALPEADIAASDQFVIKSESFEKEANESSSPLMRTGYAAMKKFFAQRASDDAARQTPLAVFVTCDAHLPGVIKAVQESGLRVPEQIAIAGFSDSDLAEHAGVTVISQPRELIGYQAVKRLLALMKNPALPLQHISLNPRMLVR
jgi:LacI family transcriptional regulator